MRCIRKLKEESYVAKKYMAKYTELLGTSVRKGLSFFRQALLWRAPGSEEWETTPCVTNLNKYLLLVYIIAITIQKPTNLLWLKPLLELGWLSASTKQGNFIKHRSKAKTKKNLNQCMAILIVASVAC